MKIPELIKIMENKLSTLNSQRVNAETVGDIELIASIDQTVIDTQLTLDQLRSL
jgi:hypothetical protein